MLVWIKRVVATIAALVIAYMLLIAYYYKLAGDDWIMGDYQETLNIYLANYTSKTGKEVIDLFNDDLLGEGEEFDEFVKFMDRGDIEVVPGSKRSKVIYITEGEFENLSDEELEELRKNGVRWVFHENTWVNPVENNGWFYRMVK